jgi:hypothetical protein
MPFVVKAVFPAGQIRWLSVPRRMGIRAFSGREDADHFETEEHALAAATAMINGHSPTALRSPPKTWTGGVKYKGMIDGQSLKDRPFRGRGVAGRRYNLGMPYVAMATLIESGATSWLTAPRMHGSRTFGNRNLAETFGTEAEAKAAVHKMIQAEDCRGLAFSVQAGGLSRLQSAASTEKTNPARSKASGISPITE